MCAAPSRGGDGAGLGWEARPTALSPCRALCYPDCLGARALRSDLGQGPAGTGHSLLSPPHPWRALGGLRSENLGDHGFGVGVAGSFSSRLFLFAWRKGR